MVLRTGAGLEVVGCVSMLVIDKGFRLYRENLGIMKWRLCSVLNIASPGSSRTCVCLPGGVKIGMGDI